MKYSFKKLWNTTFLFVGPIWYLLVWMIWSSGQVQNIADKMSFLGTVIPGFLLIYSAGFFIEGWHERKKKKNLP
ncbi:MAG: hypothetical protein WCL43_04430 [Chlorobium sp.]|jgi:hypothetical protein|nr:MAG: hypothetical protein FDX12_01895 [Chlorobium sp.]